MKTKEAENAVSFNDFVFIAQSFNIYYYKKPLEKSSNCYLTTLIST